MAKSKKSKRINSSNGSSSNSDDRISNLSDDLISQILSLLPTKQAVATSILSTRWKFLWTSITNLEFDFKCHIYSKGTTDEKEKRVKRKRKKFTRFVKKVLLRVNPPSIHKFSLTLCCPNCLNFRHLYSWIPAGFGGSAGELTHFPDPALELPVSQICCNLAVLDLSRMYFDIPESVSLCLSTLKSLRLHAGKCVIASNSSISFPNLKIMDLARVEFKNVGSVNKLLSSSPLLDDLWIYDATFNDYKEELIIDIPSSLTRLSLCTLIYKKTLGYEEMFKYKINAPALQYLYLGGWLTCECLIVENSSFLVLSDLKMLSNYKNDINAESSIIRFIEEVSEVKFLTINSYFMKAFRIAFTTITSGFHNLTRLVIGFQDCRDLSMLTGGFLESMDNLEHLVMKPFEYVDIICPEQSWWIEPSNVQSWWIEPSNVPKCLISRLTSVSFLAITTGCCDQLELLRYFLKNAKVLQMLTLGANRISKKQQNVLLKKILLMPRASQTCEVAFI